MKEKLRKMTKVRTGLKRFKLLNIPSSTSQMSYGDRSEQQNRYSDNLSRSNNETKEFMKKYISIFGKPKQRKRIEYYRLPMNEDLKTKRANLSNMLSALVQVL